MTSSAAMSRISSRLCRCMRVLCLFAAIAAAAHAEPVTLERDSELRAEPRLGAPVTGKLASGASGDAQARQGVWVQVKSGETSGWLYSFNVRFGSPAASGGASGGGSVLGRVFGPRQRVNVTATIGIRGLEEEDLKQAQFDGGQLQQLDGFAASREQAEAHATEHGLAATRVEYLEPVRDTGSGSTVGDGGSPP
ncbi:MAG: hypothetical protein AB7E73_15255 [Burkholderiales bacterium]